MSSTETVMLLKQSHSEAARGNAQSGCKSVCLSFSWLITSTEDSRTLESDESTLSTPFTSPKASLEETKLLISKAFEEQKCLRFLFTSELPGGTISLSAKSLICLFTTDARYFDFLPAFFGFMKQLLAKLNNRCHALMQLSYFPLLLFEESLLEV